MGWAPSRADLTSWCSQEGSTLTACSREPSALTGKGDGGGKPRRSLVDAEF